MSFTTKVKEELSENIPNARHCRIAELAAICCFAGSLNSEKDEFVISSENILVMEKAEKLIKKIFPVDIDERIFYDIRRSGKDGGGIVFGKNEKKQLFSLLKINELSDDGSPVIGNRLLMSACCKRAFLRGAFLTGGSLTNPEKDYHLEIVCSSAQLADRIVGTAKEFNIEAKTVIRKKQYVVYIKDGEEIVDFLNITEAHVALMDMENIRILKDMRNMVNRRVNCETANIKKTSIAAAKQISDIEFIKATIGLDELGEGLSETARLRVEYPEASLAELGNLHVTKVGRSGVNHRLSRISEMAEKIRNVKK